MTDDQILSLTREAGWNGICMELIGPSEKKSIFTPTSIRQIRKFIELLKLPKDEPLTPEEIISIGKNSRSVEGEHFLPFEFARAIERAHGIVR